MEAAHGRRSSSRRRRQNGTKRTRDWERPDARSQTSYCLDNVDSYCVGDDPVLYEPLDRDDSDRIARNSMLKYWYLVRTYRLLLFRFKEPLSQLESHHSRMMKKLQHSTPLSFSVVDRVASMGSSVGSLHTAPSWDMGIRGASSSAGGSGGGRGGAGGAGGPVGATGGGAGGRQTIGGQRSKVKRVRDSGHYARNESQSQRSERPRAHSARPGPDGHKVFHHA